MIPDLLTVLVFGPAVAAFISLLIPSRFTRIHFYAGLTGVGFAFGWLLRLLWIDFRGSSSTIITSIVSWVPSHGITYLLGLNGVSLILGFLVTSLCLIAYLTIGWEKQHGQKSVILMFLLLETAALGVLYSLDLVLFLIFWFLVLLFVFMLLGFCRSQVDEKKLRANFIFLAGGALVLFFSILCVLHIYGGEKGFASSALSDLMALSLPLPSQVVLCGLFLFAFGIPGALFPLHSWYPDLGDRVPAWLSLFLQGILLNLGAYGIIHVAWPLFPRGAAYLAPYVAMLAVAGVLHGSWVALAEENMRRKLVWLGAAQGGMVWLGLASLTSLGMTGAVFHMVAHGFAVGGLFLLAWFLERRRDTLQVDDFGGLAGTIPRFGMIFGLFVLVVAGFPGFVGFMGTFLVLLGTFHSTWLESSVWIAGVAGLGCLLSGGVLLRLFERTFFGPVRFAENRSLRDFSWFEGVVLVIPVSVMIGFGLRPDLLTKRIVPAVTSVAERIADPGADIWSEEKNP